MLPFSFPCTITNILQLSSVLCNDHYSRYDIQDVSKAISCYSNEKTLPEDMIEVTSCNIVQRKYTYKTSSNHYLCLQHVLRLSTLQYQEVFLLKRVM